MLSRSVTLNKLDGRLLRGTVNKFKTQGFVKELKGLNRVSFQRFSLFNDLTIRTNERAFNGQGMRGVESLSDGVVAGLPINVFRGKLRDVLIL
jgi:hypothetical protein